MLLINTQKSDPAAPWFISALAVMATKEELFVRMLHRMNRRPFSNATPMLGDNKASFDLIQQEGASSRTRYFERATLLIKRAVLLLLVQPYLIATQYMIADIFTKALPRDTFVKMRGQLMNLHSPLRKSVEDGMMCMTGRMRRMAQHMFA